MTSCPLPSNPLFNNIKDEMKKIENKLRNSYSSNGSNRSNKYSGGNLFAGPMSIILFTIALFKTTKQDISQTCFLDLNNQFSTFDNNGNEDYVDDMMGVLFMNPQYLLILVLYLYSKNNIPNLTKNALILIKIFKNYAKNITSKSNLDTIDFKNYDNRYALENDAILHFNDIHQQNENFQFKNDDKILNMKFSPKKISTMKISPELITEKIYRQKDNFTYVNNNKTLRNNLVLHHKIYNGNNIKFKGHDDIFTNNNPYMKSKFLRTTFKSPKKKSPMSKKKSNEKKNSIIGANKKKTRSKAKKWIKVGHQRYE